MSNYSVTTNFGSKDALTSGDPNKLILGSQLTTEFTNIATAISTKLDAGSGFANPTASAGLTAVNGVATTAMRSDAAPAISQAISPTWTGTHTFSDSTLTTAFAGKVTIGSPNAGTPLSISSATAGTNAVAMTNTLSTGAAQASFINDAGRQFYFGRTGSAFSGSVLTNGPTGECVFLGMNGSFPLSIGTNNVENIRIVGAGNVTINAPSSGTTLNMAAVDNQSALLANLASATNGFAVTLQHGGATVGQLGTGAATCTGAALSDLAINAPAGVLRLTTNGNTNRGIAIAAAGNVTVNAPSSGVALTVTGVSNANVISATASGTGAALIANSQIQDTWRAMRSSDSVITSNATLASDAVLTFSSLPAGSYEFTALIKFVGANTGAQGLKYAFAAGGTLTASFFVANGLVNTAPSTSGTFIAMTNAISYTPINTTNGDGVLISGSFITSTAGSFAIQFAQNSSSVDSTTIKAGSRLEVRRIA